MIFAAGTGNPYFTTDTAAALRALEIDAEAILMAKNGVRGRLRRRPAHSTRTREFLPELTHLQAIERGLKVMDTTALSLCMDNDLPIHVFELAPGNIGRVVARRARRHDHLDTHPEGGRPVTTDRRVHRATRRQRMDKSVETTHEHFNSVRTGRASGGAARPDPDRLLRHADAAARTSRRSTSPEPRHAHDPAVRPDRRSSRSSRRSRSPTSA